jgi:glycosyltransferase involved in cell wall biosynthesis
MNQHTQKKQVLYVITKSNFGGAQRYVYDLARHLPKDQYDVTVALGGTGEKHAQTGTLATKLHDAGITVITLKHFVRDMSLVDDVRVFFDLVHVVRRVRPDILHVSSSKAGGLGAVVGRLLFVPRVIFTSHGLSFDENWRPLWQRILIAFFTWLTFMFAHYSVQITNSAYKRARAQPFMKKRQVLIHNGRTVPTFVSRTQARQTLLPNTATKELWIGAISELTMNKNIHSLIRAVALLHERGLHPHLVVCSDGEEKRTLLNLARELHISKYVHLLGFVPSAATFLRAFDIFTLPSYKEGLPYVLMEAGHAALPVVASDIPGITDLITDKVSGILSEPTPKALADALELLLRNETLRKTYGTALQKHVQKEFSITSMIKQTLMLYVSTNPSSS